MSHSSHANVTADQRAERRARRAPRKPLRRTGTRVGILRAESLDDLGLVYPTWSPLVISPSGSVELRGRADR